MEMINISLGNIVSIGYDESRKVLRVKLKNSTYEYNRVPKHVFHDFLTDQNKTKFYRSRIKCIYSTHKIK